MHYVIYLPPASLSFDVLLQYQVTLATVFGTVHCSGSLYTEHRFSPAIVALTDEVAR